MTKTLLRGFHLSAKGQEDLSHEFHAQPLSIYFWPPYIFMLQGFLSLFHSRAFPLFFFSPIRDENPAGLKSHVKGLTIVASDAFIFYFFYILNLFFWGFWVFEVYFFKIMAPWFPVLLYNSKICKRKHAVNVQHSSVFIFKHISHSSCVSQLPHLWKYWKQCIRSADVIM